MNKAEKLLHNEPYHVVSKYVDGKYVGQYLYKSVIYYGEVLVEEKSTGRIVGQSRDHCNLCGWKGLDSEVEINQCPVCGSTDLEDIEL